MTIETPGSGAAGRLLSLDAGVSRPPICERVPHSGRCSADVCGRRTSARTYCSVTGSGRGGRFRAAIYFRQEPSIGLQTQISATPPPSYGAGTGTSPVAALPQVLLVTPPEERWISQSPLDRR